jgi:hypothetical protein
MWVHEEIRVSSILTKFTPLVLEPDEFCLNQAENSTPIGSCLSAHTLMVARAGYLRRVLYKGSQKAELLQDD